MYQLFDKFQNLNILIIGDVMIDAYLWGKVDRISPEAPVPIVSVVKRESRMGGAANVALNVKQLGIQTFICGVIGNDTEGELFLNLLEQQNVSDEGIVKTANRTTTTKTRVIGHHQQMLRIDAENTDLLDAIDRRKIFDKISWIIEEQQIDAIIFQDYDKGVISEELIEQTVTLARQKNIITIVDPKKNNFLSYKNVTLFKPNLKELREGLKMDIDANNLDDLRKATNRLRDLIQAEIIMITLSELGVYVSTLDGDKLIPAHIRNIADVSGAGDTVVSVVAACLAAGANPYFAAEIGNLAGGLVCEKIGVVPIEKMQLLAEAQHYHIGE